MNSFFLKKLFIIFLNNGQTAVHIYQSHEGKPFFNSVDKKLPNSSSWGEQKKIHISSSNQEDCSVHTFQPKIFNNK